MTEKRRLGGSEWAEIAACGLLAALIAWTRDTLSELVRHAYARAPVLTITIPLVFIALAVFLYFHFFGWHLPWSASL